jgi:hypothetical protein
LHERRREDPRVKWIADQIWEVCWERQRKHFEEADERDIERKLRKIRLILDSLGRPNYFTALSLARRIVRLMDKYGVSIDTFNAEDDVDCTLEPPELISVLLAKWAGDKVTSLYDFVSDIVDALEFSVYALESQIRELERMTPEELKGGGINRGAKARDAKSS